MTDAEVVLVVQSIVIAAQVARMTERLRDAVAAVMDSDTDLHIVDNIATSASRCIRIVARAQGRWAGSLPSSAPSASSTTRGNPLECPVLGRERDA